MRGSALMIVVAAAGAIYCQAAFAQHGDFAPKVQLILDYLKDSGEPCVSPQISGVRPFKACREGTDEEALTVVTRLPVRDDDGRVIDACSAKLIATRVRDFRAVNMEVSAPECSATTLRSGEFSPIFVRIILELAEWVQKKEKPI
jgi:hypothetical protein